MDQLPTDIVNLIYLNLDYLQLAPLNPSSDVWKYKLKEEFGEDCETNCKERYLLKDIRRKEKRQKFLSKDQNFPEYLALKKRLKEIEEERESENDQLTHELARLMDQLEESSESEPETPQLCIYTSAKIPKCKREATHGSFCLPHSQTRQAKEKNLV